MQNFLMAYVRILCEGVRVEFSLGNYARFFVHAASLRLAHKIIELLKSNRVQISFYKPRPDD